MIGLPKYVKNKSEWDNIKDIITTSKSTCNFKLKDDSNY